MRPAPAIDPNSVAAEPERHIAPVPRITIQAFCETAELAHAVQSAGADRRMARAHLKVSMGGLAAADEAYRNASTPNVIMIEYNGHGNALLEGLDRLAEVCDAGTKVIVVGRVNDIILYRELTRRGVSDYLVSPLSTLDIVASISGLFSAADAKPVGRIIGVLGAKGGVGASTVAHNIAFAIARDLAIDAVVADLDLPFGTAGLDFNQDPPQGIADAVFSPDRVDTAFIDRLLSKCTDHLSLLASPATLDREYDFSPEAIEPVLDTLRGSVPYIVLDLPHLWSGWAKRALTGADELLIVAAPDLPNLRNAKNIYDFAKAARPNDKAPMYLLNQVGIPKRPEVRTADFAKALEAEPVAIIPFEPQLFGTASNNGQMIAEVAAKHKTADTFLSVAKMITGRAEAKAQKKDFLSPLLARLKRK
ncbi:MAG: CtpF protein [Xanthobacteraceae bacterium]|nr:CtpF protein [Xanthobacteraceae bacterium]QYK45277.1 MAG: CtpF protein [Xanthobacteraceae bacterium]